MVVALTLRIRHRFSAVRSHAGGAHDVPGAFRMGKMSDVGRADCMKQLLVRFASRRQSGRSVRIQSEEYARLWYADHVTPVEVRRYPVVGIGQLLGACHQGHLPGRVRSHRVQEL
jgi:hypothetical protein